MGGPRIHNVCVLLMYSVVAFCKDLNLSTVGRPWPLDFVKDWPRGLAAWESSFCNGWAQLANTTIGPFSMAMSEYLQICAFCNGRASWVLPAWPKIGFSETLLQNDVAYKLRRLFLNIASMEIWSLGLSFCSDDTPFFYIQDIENLANGSGIL